MDWQRFLFNNLRDGNAFGGNGNFVFQGSKMKMKMSLGDCSKRMPYFSSAEELIYDDEYLDEQLSEKKRRLTPDQVNILEKSFEDENRLEPERKNQLAKKLGLQPRQVSVWFQNRRARLKTKQLESNYDQLKSTYDSLAYTAPILDGEVPSDGGGGWRLTAGRPDHSKGGGPYISSGSAVMDEDCPKLFDSRAESHFPEGRHRAADGVYSEEDDGRGGYFSDVFAATEPISWLI